MKSNERKIEAKKVSCVDYLSSLGFIPSKETGGYYHYFSPLPGRNEKAPSFLVRKKDGKWSDRGVNPNWEDVIELVMKMQGCNFNNAVDILLNGQITATTIQKQPKKDTPSVIIHNLDEIKSRSLLHELNRRMVNIDIAKIYCKEAEITFPLRKNPNKLHKVIAFKNDLGGYEFRNRILKISNSPKFYTTIKCKGNDRDFFEGFIDFLSLLTYLKIEKPKNTSYILNSISYLNHLFDIMKGPGINNMYLNWGFSACQKYCELIEHDIPYEDQRDLYLMYDDINDMLRNHARLK